MECTDWQRAIFATNGPDKRWGLSFDAFSRHAQVVLRDLLAHTLHGAVASLKEADL